MDLTPPPSQNYAGIGTHQRSYYHQERPLPLPYPSSSPARNHAGGSIVHHTTQRGRKNGQVAHQGFLDLMSYVPRARVDEGYDQEDHDEGDDEGGRGDRRWDWAYDVHGNPVSGEHRGEVEETIGTRYEDLPVSVPSSSTPGPAWATATARAAPPGHAVMRRQPSEATQMLRLISQPQPQPHPQAQIRGGNPPGPDPSGSTYLDLSSWINPVLSPVVGTLGYIGSTLRGRAGVGVGGSLDPNVHPDIHANGDTQEGGVKDLPGLPGGRGYEGVPLPTKKIPRKPVNPIVDGPRQVLDQEQAQPSASGAGLGTSKATYGPARTVRILQPAPSAPNTPSFVVPYPKATLSRTENTWKPRGQIGSIMLNTTRQGRTLQRPSPQHQQQPQQQGRFLDPARGERKPPVQQQAQGGRSGQRPGGLDKRMISWPLDFRCVSCLFCGMLMALC